MALFLEVHELVGHDTNTFVAPPEANGHHVTCLRHWVGDERIAVLMEAPDRESLRSRRPEPVAMTELLAPASRWMSTEAIALLDAGHRHRENAA